jgi:phosphomannomutase
MINGFADASSCWKTILADVKKNSALLPVIEKFAYENADFSPIVFGTSGWRGEIGSDFTFKRLRIVVDAIIEMFREEDPAVMADIGVSGFDEIRRRGVIVGHDNRFLGKDFAMEAIGRFQNSGIRAWYAGEAPTPEYSSGLEMTGAACSVNLTPSHNPANYAGFKFNPSDGGPAGSGITTRIEAIANRMLSEKISPEAILPASVDNIDLTDIYIKYLIQRKTIDLSRIKHFIEDADCMILIDNVHGSTRNRVQRILGLNPKIRYLRTEDDYLFGGFAPEPSEKNMSCIDAELSKSAARFKLGVIMDPDGDRVRHSDGTVQIPMNYFGGMALHFLHAHKGLRGVAVKSVATSNFVNAIAAQLGIGLRETAVGFKNFRPYLLPSAKEKAIVAFEESDGISGYNHTLEKDALFGLLLAIEMLAVTGMNLGDYLKELMCVFGSYYPDRSGISVDKSLAGNTLIDKLSVINNKYPAGAAIDIDGHKHTINDVISVDGIKMVLDDGSWLMIRPSGTEPKVRFYIEARTEETKQSLLSAAEKITKDALK